MASPSLRTSTTQAPAVPRQDPRVVGLSASGGVEGGAVEGDAITIDRKHLGIERAQLRVVEVEQSEDIIASLQTDRAQDLAQRSHHPRVERPDSAYRAEASSKRIVYTTSLRSSGCTAKSVTPHSKSSTPVEPVTTWSTRPENFRPLAPRRGVAAARGGAGSSARRAQARAPGSIRSRRRSRARARRAPAGHARARRPRPPAPRPPAPCRRGPPRPRGGARGRREPTRRRRPRGRRPGM